MEHVLQGGPDMRDLPRWSPFTPRFIRTSQLASFACALLLAACSRGSLPPDPKTADAGPDHPADTTSPATEAGPELAASPDLASDPSPVDTRDVPEDQGPDTRDVAAAETTFSEVSPETAGETGRDGPDAPAAATCVADLSGSAPFGKALSGTASFGSSYSTAAPITSTFTAYVYFPAGRVAGAPVQLAIQSRVISGQYFFGPQATLASDLSATGLTVGGHDVQITGGLLPGAGGLQATVAANFSDPASDLGDDRSAAMLMCPTGDVPAPALKVASGTLSPLSTIALGSTTPLAQEAINALRITSPLGAVAFNTSIESN